jgi:hypothetical protein
MWETNNMIRGGEGSVGLGICVVVGSSVGLMKAMAVLSDGLDANSIFCEMNLFWVIIDQQLCLN